MTKIIDMWNWHGRIGRARYLAIGVVLLAIKHNIDRIVAASHGYPWSVFNYWVYKTPSSVQVITQNEATFYAELIFIALPFIWIGTVLTVRRLRDAGLPLWLVVFFFLSFLNLLFFAILVVIPCSQTGGKTMRNDSLLSRLVPRGEFGSAALGIVATAILSTILTVVSTSLLGNYGWGVFVGIPFFLGLNSVLIYSFHEPRSLPRCIGVAVLSTTLVGLALFGLAIEGIICLAMALPLAAILALIGGIVGWAIQKRPAIPVQSFRVISAVFLFIPALILLEYSIDQKPPVYAVKTSVVIDAPPDVVWKNVVSFSQLPPPTETVFKTGIAYPIRAEIQGRGEGAVRHCIFSTGEFVEPITKWDEPRLLAFSVSGQPPTMEELSIYHDLHPPHLEHYLISQHGQFELKELPGGKTLLEGTTWYQNRYWPGVYWHLWSDAIIHRIHQRVLNHIKTLSESQ
ncbi:MAG TPA: DUF805 domain-containing protein [Pyrinomonadaceae bacterium]